LVYNRALTALERQTIELSLGFKYSLTGFDDEADTDGDGISDADEISVHHTNPTLLDTDGDGMPDGWEIAHGLNPLSAADGALDSDGDGMSNAAEFLAGRDPHNALDKHGLPSGATAVLPTDAANQFLKVDQNWTLTPTSP
jgi:hypothetical protein